jgi:hypothetical protein
MKKTKLTSLPCSKCICAAICKNKSPERIYKDCSILRRIDKDSWRMSQNLARRVDIVLQPTNWTTIKIKIDRDGKKVTSYYIKNLKGITRKELNKQLENYQEEYDDL